MRYNKDNRTVMTMDGGGTNFVFSAMQHENEIIEPITYPSMGHDLNQSLETIIKGLKEVQSKLSQAPVAISFCFPGPADFERGIIGDLVNLPGYRGGVALGPMLEEQFGIPVYLNNDGDLFTYGESIAGLLPWINTQLQDAGSPKQYANLFGTTFGTGFGGGIVSHGSIIKGDNSAGGEINRMRNKLLNDSCAEESVSIHGVQDAFIKYSGIDNGDCPEPKHLYEIAQGTRDGDQASAKKAFYDLSISAGDALANAVTLVDGLIVIGGGLSNAWPLFLETLVEEMNRPYNPKNGIYTDRLEVKAFNLENKNHLDAFLKGKKRTINIPKSKKTIQYDPLQRIGVGISKLGTGKAVSIGAYTYALNMLDKNYH